MKISNLKYLFNNLNDGCVLAFYGKKWTAKIIPFFTREIAGEDAPQHVGIIYEVKRSENKLTFKLSEQGFHGGQYRDVEIVKYGEIYYTTDNYFLKQEFVKMFQVDMNEDQIKLGIADAISQIGKKYGYTRLIFGIELLEKIFTKEFQRKLFLKINKKEKQRVCSTHVQFNLRKAGLKIPLDTWCSPLEITKLDIYKK